MNPRLLSLVIAGLWGCTGSPSTVIVDAATTVDTGFDAEVDATAETPWTMPTRAVCEGRYGVPVDGAALGDDDLVETSGLVASPSRSGILWMHNDSGDTARLYAVGTDGQPRGRLTLPGEAGDWEDIAAAPCPDGSGPCLWVGDIGDNTAERDDVAILAVPEPQTDGDHQAEQVWRFPVVYPNGPRDAEALIVSPSGREFWLFEKDEDGRVRAFHNPGPLVDGMPITLTKSDKFDAPGLEIENGRMITAADLHPGGQRLLLRVYTGTYEYRFGPGQGPMDLQDISPELVAFGPLSEPQGEAVAYDETGMGIITVSEDTGQKPGQPLHHYPCEAP